MGTIYHPSLPEHPGHEIAKKQQLGFGSMLSFEFFAELFEALKYFVDKLGYFLWLNHSVVLKLDLSPCVDDSHRAMGSSSRGGCFSTTTAPLQNWALEDAEDLIDDPASFRKNATLYR
ncbi:PLP-dependent transferase [Vibrio lentus]|nr:PLP-dependent transferase [Vibrio lentus]